MTSNTRPYIRVTNIGKYIEGNKARDNNYCIIYPSGEFVYLLHGIEIPGLEFERNNPLPVLQENKNDKGMRLDSRSNWFD